jgi:hypothetical protein
MLISNILLTILSGKSARRMQQECINYTPIVSTLKTNKKFLTVICFLFLSFLMTKPSCSQIPVVHPSRSDEIQDSGELAYYFRWLENRIYTSKPSRNALPPSSTICGGQGAFSCTYQLIDGEDRYTLFASFFRGNCPKSFRPFFTFLEDKNYRIRYIAIRKNTIFPLYGSLYCLDQADKPYSKFLTIVVSAFRISDNDIPKELTLQRRSIVFPICEDVKNFQGLGDPACQYEGSVYIVSYGLSPTPSEGPCVKLSTSLLVSQEEQRRQYEEFLKKYPNPYRDPQYSPCNGVKEGWYKIGDIVPFQTVAHKIINIVLPDKEDCRIVHRKNKDGSITELKCRLIGWVELDPTPIPLSKN